MQSGKLHEARASFAEVLLLEPGNTVAQQIMARFAELDLPDESDAAHAWHRESINVGGCEILLVGRGEETHGTCGANLWASAPALVEWVV